jgi:hypothetical protein
MEGQWTVWRPVLAKVATLHEIECYWSLGDLMRANMALDIQVEQDRLINKGT